MSDNDGLDSRNMSEDDSVVDDARRAQSTIVYGELAYIEFRHDEQSEWTRVNGSLLNADITWDPPPIEWPNIRFTIEKLTAAYTGTITGEWLMNRFFRKRTKIARYIRQRRQAWADLRSRRAQAGS